VHTPLGSVYEKKPASQFGDVQEHVLFDHQSPLARFAKLPAGQTYTQPQQLAGKYVKACEKGRGCHLVYLPETTKHWDDAKHTEVVMESGLPLPVGPTARKPVSALATPFRDTARPEPDHSIYGVFTGSFFRA